MADCVWNKNNRSELNLLDLVCFFRQPALKLRLKGEIKITLHYSGNHMEI